MTDAVAEFNPDWLKHNPVAHVLWVPLEKVYANDYNPNSVALMEMRLLYVSIDHDGFTQPVVTVLDKRCELRLPCDHLIHISDQEHVLWTLFCPLSGSLHTPPVLLMAKEASASNIGRPAEVDIVSRSHRRKPTTEETCVTGSKTSGKWDASTRQTVSAPSTSGTSPESTTSRDCWELVCPTCASSDPERKKCWTSFRVLAASGAASGLRLSCVSSKSTEAPLEAQNLPGGSVEALTLLERNDTNSGSTGLHGTPVYRLEINDLTRAIIVDGFHRYSVMKRYPDIYARNHGFLPIVVLDKPLNDRMASTIRHNRARGKHSITGMSALVVDMLNNGWSDERVCGELGLEKQELIRLKHVTGYASFFLGGDYSRAMETNRQIEERLSHERKRDLGE
jgi:hypothetical protein